MGFLFACLASGITIYLCLTLNETPLTEWATWDIQWSNNWLWMSTLDYYGAATCLTAIALSSEAQLPGLLWTVGFMVLGSPVCCAYVCYRCFYFKNLELSSNSNGDGQHQRGRYSMAARDESSAAL